MFKFSSLKGDKKKATEGSGGIQGNEAPHNLHDIDLDHDSDDDIENNNNINNNNNNNNNNDAFSRTSRAGEHAEPSRGAVNQTKGNKKAAAAKNQENNNNNNNNNKSNIMGNFTNRIENAASGIMSFIEGKSAVNIFLVITGVNLFFTILGTTLSQIDIIDGACLTYWGYKSNCDTVSYSRRTQLLECSETRHRLQVGAAFSIIAILLIPIVLYLTLQAFMHYRNEAKKNRYTTSSNITEEGNNNNNNKVIISHKWHIVRFSAIILFCEMICWALTANICISHYCEDPIFPNEMTYGVGFGLLLVGWILEIVALVIFVIVV